MSKCTQVEEATRSWRLALVHTQRRTHLNTHTHTDPSDEKFYDSMCTRPNTHTCVHTHTLTAWHNNVPQRHTHTLMSPGHSMAALVLCHVPETLSHHGKHYLPLKFQYSDLIKTPQTLSSDAPPTPTTISANELF